MGNFHVAMMYVGLKSATNNVDSNNTINFERMSSICSVVKSSLDGTSIYVKLWMQYEMLVAYAALCIIIISTLYRVFMTATGLSWKKTFPETAKHNHHKITFNHIGSNKGLSQNHVLGKYMSRAAKHNMVI